MARQENVIIYSHQSEPCRQLIKKMEQCGIIQLFRHIDISKPGVRVPRGISHIPTLLVVGIQNPLVGQEAEYWINNIIMQRRQKEQQQQRESKQLPPLEEKKFNPYEESTMNSFSDKFCLLKDDMLPQNFANPKESINVFTAPEQKQKIGKDKHDALMRERIDNRNEQDKMYKDHIETIINKLKSSQPQQKPLRY